MSVKVHGFWGAGSPGGGGAGDSGRELLTAARTYFVGADGNDNNDGMSVNSPFATIQRAIDLVADTLDIAAGVVVTINVGAGTWTVPVVLRMLAGAGSAVIEGDTATPANVTIHTTNATAVAARWATRWKLTGLRLLTTTGGSALSVSEFAQVDIEHIDFGACAQFQIAATRGGVVTVTGPIVVSGGGAAHALAFSAGLVHCSYRAVTLTGTPAFSIAFAYVRDRGGYYCEGTTYTGSATGKRYQLEALGLVWTAGQSTSFLPGGTAGTTATGGQYA